MLPTPLKKPPSSTSDLISASRNVRQASAVLKYTSRDSRQKSVLITETARDRWEEIIQTMRTIRTGSRKAKAAH